MGWTGIYEKPKSLKEFFFQECNTSKIEPVDCRVVGTTIYGACRIRATNEIFGLVVLTSKTKKEFLYSEQQEDHVPCYYDCPEAILKLLSPTDNEWSLKWRNKCRENAKKKKSISSKNVLIEVETPIKFNNGLSFSFFEKRNGDWWASIKRNDGEILPALRVRLRNPLGHEFKVINR
jgi:hypothetical protein